MLVRLLNRADQTVDCCSKDLLQFCIYQTQKWKRKENRSYNFISLLFNPGISQQKVNFRNLPAFEITCSCSENWSRTATVVCAINYLIKLTQLPLCSSSARGLIFKSNFYIDQTSAISLYAYPSQLTSFTLKTS